MGNVKADSVRHGPLGLDLQKIDSSEKER